ncbi:substrate-binding periplasmic protein [Undibacterium luofuense]|uniref:substrate-binding periplasmic protein n=1 Tax=Undibacterium luofuense TaxID=2828733 RepID=UPI0030EEA613
MPFIRQFLKILVSSLAGLYLLCTVANAAACTRVIQVPMAPTGFSVFVRQGKPEGVYPDMLRQIATASGCKMTFSVVPRARLEMLFETGQADVLIPAIRTSRRDRHGIFVPLLYTRATLIGMRQQGVTPPASLDAVLKNPALQIGLVRGFDYGDAYMNWMQSLQQQNRVQLESDPVSVARLMKAGSVQYTMMAPYIFAGSVAQDARVADMAASMQYLPVPEVDWTDSGIYLSLHSLNETDRNHLKKALEEAARSGVVWKSFQQYYGPDVLNAGSKPR